MNLLIKKEWRKMDNFNQDNSAEDTVNIEAKKIKKLTKTQKQALEKSLLVNNKKKRITIPPNVTLAELETIIYDVVVPEMVKKILK